MKRINGTKGDDVIYGLGVDDIIQGRDGADTVYAGSSDDIVYGGDGNDWLYGEDGSDTIYGGNDTDRIYGGDGSDVIFTGEGGALVVAGSGDDFLFGAAGSQTLFGDDGNDFLYSGGGGGSMFGGAGNDTIVASDAHVGRMAGDEGDDVFIYNTGDVNLSDIVGSSLVIHAGEGNDVLFMSNELTEVTELVLYAESPRCEVFFSDQGGVSDPEDRVALFVFVEQFELTSGGALHYNGSLGFLDMTVIGNRSNDIFLSGRGSENFSGRGGDDQFVAAGAFGADTWQGGEGDSDLFELHTDGSGSIAIDGFDGAGSDGGDRLVIHGNPGEVTVTEDAGQTTFAWATGACTVNVINMVSGADYWFA